VLLHQKSKAKIKHERRK
jgi:hypothetical protein